MRGSSRRKRVSWPADVNLCQVRLFLSDEAPSQVGVGIQDNLQAKASSHLHPSATALEDNLPPGFEGAQPANRSNKVVFEVPIIKWKCPAKFSMDVSWHVVSGEESQEVEAEHQRGMRVFEAIYPRPSSIPPNAAVAADVTEALDDHQQPRVIPITATDDEDHGITSSMRTSTQGPVADLGSFSIPMYTGHNIASTSSNNNMAVAPPGVEPDVAAAASAAYTAILKTNELGNQIDRDLLLQILSNPTLIEKLSNGYTNSKEVPPPQNFPPVNYSNPPATQISQPELSTQSITGTSTNGAFYPQPKNTVQQPPSLGPISAPPQPSRDLNYYKSLIQKHGEDRTETPQHFGPHSHSQYAEDRQEAPQQFGPRSHSQYEEDRQEVSKQFGSRHNSQYGEDRQEAPQQFGPRSYSQYGEDRQEVPTQFGPRPSSHYGEDRPEAPQQYGPRSHSQYGMNQDQQRKNPQARDNRDPSRPKIMKPCMFFNTPRGCRHGANCSFQHDTSYQPRAKNYMPDNKRMKMDREITGA